MLLFYNVIIKLIFYKAFHFVYLFWPCGAACGVLVYRQSLDIPLAVGERRPSTTGLQGGPILQSMLSDV